MPMILSEFHIYTNKMKKIITVILIFFCLLAQAGTPARVVKYPNATTAFNETLPIGTLIIDTNTGKVYNSLQSLVSTKTIATCSLVTELNDITSATISGTTNYITKFASSSTVGNSQIYDNGSYLGINTSTSTHNIGFNGTANKTIGVETNTTSNTAGSNLTINAGNATSGATDKNGGNLVFQGGVNMGSGSGGSILFQTSPPITTGGIKTISIASGGYNYAVGNTLQIQAGNNNASATVASQSGGAITGLTITNIGTNISVGSGGITTLSGSGYGALIDITSITSTSNGALATSPSAMAVFTDQSVAVGYSTAQTGYLFAVNGAVKATSATFTTGAGTGKIWTSDAYGNGVWAALGGEAYKGELNGITGVPVGGTWALINGTGTTGWRYACSTTGPNTHDYGNPSGNNITLSKGDQLYYNGTIWIKIPGAGSYTLPAATSGILGGIKAGTGITMTGDVASIPNDGKVFVNGEATPYKLNSLFFDSSTGVITPKIDLVPANGSYLPVMSNGVYQALLAKQNSLTLTTTGSSGAATLVGATLNIPQYAGGGSMTYPGAGIPISTGSAWGTSITNASTNWNNAYTNSGKVKIVGGSTAYNLSDSYFTSTGSAIYPLIQYSPTIDITLPVSSDGVYQALLSKLSYETDTLFTTISLSDETTDLTTGTAVRTFRMPIKCKITKIRMSVNTAPTGSTIIIDINESGTSILSTKLSIDATEKTSVTASIPVVISDNLIADDAEMKIDIDQKGSTIAGKGLKVVIYYIKN